MTEITKPCAKFCKYKYSLMFYLLASLFMVIIILKSFSQHFFKFLREALKKVIFNGHAQLKRGEVKGCAIKEKRTFLITFFLNL